MTNFTREDFERAFGSVSVHNRPLFVDTFTQVFSAHPPEDLVGMPPETLDLVVSELAKRADVRRVQDVIAEEVVHGEESLRHLAAISFGQLQKLGIAPSDKRKIYYKPYQEAWAYCGTDVDTKRADGKFEPSMPIAKGLFEPRIPLENIFFMPENTFYSDLPSLYMDGRLACQHGHRDVRLRRAGALHVYRDKATDTELTSRVRRIIKNTSDRTHRGIKSDGRRYETAERDIIDELYEMFKSLKTVGTINYKKVYKIFEWIVRENIDISQVIENPELRKILREEIEKYVPLPYAAIRVRVKGPDGEVLKVLRALYNLTTGDEQDGTKKYKDKYGLRIVVPRVKDVFELVKSFRTVVGLEVTNPEDYITNPKPNGYRSYHMDLIMGETPYDLQIRTHQMDRDAEKDPKQAHESVFRQKLMSLEIVPVSVKRVVATVYGI